MKNSQFTKAPLFGIPYAAVDYKSATEIIVHNAVNRNSFGVSALAVHGLMESIHNEKVAQHVPHIDMIVPDGKPVQWALNLLNNTALPDRVSGPDLTQHVLQAASINHLRVYLYGSTATTLEKLNQHISKQYPGVTVCGIHVDRFRDATPEEDAEDIRKINESGAHIVLVGRGCPRQEIWVAQHMGKVNAVMMAVGAAFDYLVGNIQRAPIWMQRSGLEWSYRLAQEPRRLFKRYAITNSLYVYYVLQQLLTKRLPHAVSRPRI
ncbi:glycosyltransferase [Fibrisoma montanum]|uniref:Glycosyltransferase n=1 Tax=Fibrisoma montanum TaxID=2305895 RepID=A0A418MAQ6_9BACT|nr:WecB/TagA/CpsF family glycosyltransferase [Fibrisoma montanum]RIV23426.1 glycosyltransferase [Fibrisoma montanum]